MRRSLPVLAAIGLLAAGLLASTVTLIAVGTGAAGPPADACPPAAAVGAAPAGLPLDAGQLANARIIYTVGADLGLPQRAESIAIAAAMQDSGLRNLPYGSGGSPGLFQQRSAPGQGTTVRMTDPVGAAHAFYQRLVQVSGWQALPVTRVAEAVQRSAVPGGYARWEPLAARLVASFARTTSFCVLLDANVVTAAASATLPRNYELPATTPLAVALAIRFALAQLGTAYQFGGSCTDAQSPDMALHCDCSSLVQQAYLAAGITLPRTTFAQVTVGTPVYSLTALRAGDLLFIPGADGSAGRPGHVGIYIGDGIVLHAPQAGQDVQLSPLSAWASQIVAMRRIA